MEEVKKRLEKLPCILEPEYHSQTEAKTFQFTFHRPLSRERVVSEARTLGLEVSAKKHGEVEIHPTPGSGSLFVIGISNLDQENHLPYFVISGSNKSPINPKMRGKIVDLITKLHTSRSN